MEQEEERTSWTDKLNPGLIVLVFVVGITAFLAGKVIDIGKMPNDFPQRDFNRPRPFQADQHDLLNLPDVDIGDRVLWIEGDRTRYVYHESTVIGMEEDFLVVSKTALAMPNEPYPLDAKWIHATQVVKVLPTRKRWPGLGAKEEPDK